MNACELIHSLERIGYTLTVIDGKVCGDRQDLLPPPPESAVLLDQLRQHKGEVLDFLLFRGFEPAPPSEGDLHVITIDATNEQEMLRWHTAIDTGLIALAGKILYRTGDNTALIRYRCSFPPEWLPDAIARAAKEKYNRTLERIEKGGKWLQEHDENHSDYARCYEAYQALYENLRKLYVVIDTPLDDPMMGYGEVSQ